MISSPTFPGHGPINCRVCFTSDNPVETIGSWQAVNDPGAWGSASPAILVLGFSKGFTQAGAYSTEKFEEIPFKGMRPRLTVALRRIDLLSERETVESKFTPLERDYAFGSLVRCSLSRLNEKTGKRECTGSVMQKAFTEDVSALVTQCTRRFLADLPPSVRVVVLLGTGNPYIAGCKNVIRLLYGPGFREINEVAYATPGVTWVHIAHPSGLNGHFDSWVVGSKDHASGRKLTLALAALRPGRSGDGMTGLVTSGH